MRGICGGHAPAEAAEQLEGVVGEQHVVGVGALALPRGRAGSSVRLLVRVSAVRAWGKT